MNTVPAGVGVSVLLHPFGQPVGVAHLTPGSHVGVGTSVNVGGTVPAGVGVSVLPQPFGQPVGVTHRTPGTQVGVGSR